MPDKDYPSKARSQMLKALGYREHIQRIAKTRARVEHPFDQMRHMGGKIIRTIGQARATVAMTMKATCYNIKRLAKFLANGVDAFYKAGKHKGKGRNGRKTLKLTPDCLKIKCLQHFVSNSGVQCTFAGTGCHDEQNRAGSNEFYLRGISPTSCSIFATGAVRAVDPITSQSKRVLAVQTSEPSQGTSFTPRSTHDQHASHLASSLVLPGAPRPNERAIATPLGRIFSSNLTPDPDGGIGCWSAPVFGFA